MKNVHNFENNPFLLFQKSSETLDKLIFEISNHKLH